LNLLKLKKWMALNFKSIENKTYRTEKIENVIVKRTSRRLKTVVLRIRNGDVEILCPMHTSNIFLRGLIHEKKEWIQKKLKNSLKNLENIDQISNGYIKYKGLKLWLIYEKANFEKIVLCSKELKIFYNQNKTKNLRKLILDWLKLKSKIFLKDRLIFLSNKIDIRFNTLKIKSYKARWGSCNDKGEIFLNWKLIMLPESVIDYVLIHELAHIIVPNHSKDFWSLVESKDPSYKEKKRWLMDNGSNLISIS